MTEEKEKTFAEIIVEFALEDKREHQAYMSRLPASSMAAVIGRKGKLTVAGEDGGKFIIKITPHGIFSDDSSDDIRNDIWMTDETFIDIVIGELDPKVARARGQVLFTGDRSLYDAHEIMGLFGEWMSAKLRPIAQRMMRELARGKLGG
ncbi:hypothetical protein ES707_15865 [subsurface metagenome]